MTVATEPKHEPYMERVQPQKDGLWLVLCKSGKCRRGSNAPTVLAHVYSKRTAEQCLEAHARNHAGEDA